MYVDGPEFVLVLAQLDAEGNILTKLKNSDQWSWSRCDNKKCLRTNSWTNRRTPGSSQTVRRANNIKKGPQKRPQI